MLKKVQEEFEKYPKLRVLFYFDGDGSHIDDLAHWDEASTGITLVMGSDRYFGLKYQLHYEWADNRVFLYFPFPKPKGEAWDNFPLRSLYHANRELKLDDVAELMAQYGLPRHTREWVKRYEKDLKNKTTKAALANILNDKLTKERLEEGLIAVALGFHRTVDRAFCLAKLLILGAQDGKANRPLSKIEEWGLTDVLQHWIDLIFEPVERGVNESSLHRVACQFKYNLLVGNALPQDKDTYSARLRLKHAAQQNRLLAFYAEWQNDKTLSEDLAMVLNNYADDVDELKLVEWYGTTHEYGYFTPRMIGQLLHHAQTEVTYNPTKVREDIPTLRMRVKEDKNLNPYFDFLENAAALMGLLKQHGTSYVFNTPDIYIEKYTSELWQIDFHYRKALYAFGKLENTEGVNAFDYYALKDLLNTEYDVFLIGLNREWLEILKENKFKWGNIKAEKQYDFYDTHIRPMTGKIAVVISDAFRFEAAHDLFKHLQRDSKNDVDITAMMTALPSNTKFGMFNLLPHDKGVEAVYDDTKNALGLRIGGVSSEGLPNRRTILKQITEQSEVITEVELLKMNKAEGQAFFKLKNDDEPKIVYVFHNEIDETGDSKKSESRSFEAVENTIQQLIKILSYLSNFNVYQIWITADHGFIYNERKLRDKDYEDLPKIAGETDIRFVLSKTGDINLCDTTNLKTDVKITLPNGINRFRKQGSSMQYVHGGISLQELIVPVIRYSRDRKDKFSTVAVRLMNEDKLTIQANALKLLFLQEQPIGNRLKATKWFVGLYDMSGLKRLSTEEEEIVFDSDSTVPTGRMKTVTLRLNTEGSRSNFCYLYIYDSEDKTRLNPKVNKRIDFDTLMEIDEF